MRLSTLYRGIVAICAALPLAWADGAMAQTRYSDGYHHMWNGGWSMMIFGPLTMILFVVLIAAAVVLVFRWLSPGQSVDSGSRNRALDLLDERFARGEIDAEEYRARKQELTRR